MTYLNFRVSRFGLSQFFQLPLNVTLARIMPFIWLRLYIYLLGFLYFSIKRDDLLKLITFFYFIMRQRQSTPVYIWNLFRVFFGIFDHYYEKLIMAHRPLEQMSSFLGRKVSIKNREILDGIANAGKGGILVTGHFGAVEFLPLTLAVNGYKIAMICRFKTQKLKEELMKRAREMDVQLIDADEPKVAFKALKAINSGRLLITECDEFSEWRPHKNKKIQVFGNLVPQDKTLDFFYLRARVPAALVLMKRDLGGGFTLCVEHLADGKERISLAKVAWNRLEGYILSYPNQWYQWKGAAKELEGYVKAGLGNENQKDSFIPAKDPVFTTNIP